MTPTICPYCGVGCNLDAARAGQPDRQGDEPRRPRRHARQPLHQGPLRLPARPGARGRGSALAAPCGGSTVPRAADESRVYRLRAIGRRDALILLTMWCIGALLLVSVIGLSGRADNARKRQLVVETMREDASGSPGITWNSADLSGDVVHGRVERIAHSFRSSIARLQALGDSRYSVPIEAAAGDAVATDGMIAGLVAIGRVSLAVEVTSLSFRPGGSAFALRKQLDRADVSYRRESARADREASAASVALTLVLLIAFSCGAVPVDERAQAGRGAVDRQAGAPRAEPVGCDDRCAHGHGEPAQAVRRHRSASRDSRRGEQRLARDLRPQRVQAIQRQLRPPCRRCSAGPPRGAVSTELRRRVPGREGLPDGRRRVLRGDRCIGRRERPRRSRRPP